MIDVEQRLRDELELLAPPVGRPDWQEVLARSGQMPGRARQRRLGAAAVTVCVLVLVAVATPLGAAVVHGLGGFSSWLTGQPGKPASKQEQQAFTRANARSWLRFPSGTKLRALTAARADGTTITLLGFRSGDSLCLRVVLSGTTHGSALSCAPLSDLRAAGLPVRVVFVDTGFGEGTKHAWYGIDRVGSNKFQVTAGIAADGITRVVLSDQAGRHTVPAVSNSFLYVAPAPDVGQRVLRIWAESAAGRLRPVPFAPAPFGFLGGNVPQRAATGPTRVDRKVVGGTIGWLDRRQPIGQALELVPARLRSGIARHVVFGRLITPDPSRLARIAITLATSRNGRKPTGVCYWLITRASSGGGCAPRGSLFARGPVNYGSSLDTGSDQFATLAGVASDDVAQITAYLANGQILRVPLRDNAFVVDVARSKFPVRLVAYDKQHRVIGLTTDQGFDRVNAGPARGRARLLLRGRSATGATAELYVGKSSTGGTCTYIRWHVSRTEAGEGAGCTQPDWRRFPLELETQSTPALFVFGQVSPAVTKVRFRFADGARAIVDPTDGYVLYTVPEAHLTAGHELIAADALAADGKLIGSEPYPHAKR